MLEGANINRSLLSLGNCINVLSDPKKKVFYYCLKKNINFIYYQIF